MPSIYEVKFNADLITDPFRSTGHVKYIAERGARIESPVTTTTVEVQNRGYVIPKYNVYVKPARHKSARLKQVVVYFKLSSLVCLLIGWRDACWETETTGFVNFCQLADNVIVEAIEANEKRTDTRRLSKNSRFGKCIGLQSSILKSSNSSLLSFIMTV